MQVREDGVGGGEGMREGERAVVQEERDRAVSEPKITVPSPVGRDGGA